MSLKKRRKQLDKKIDGLNKQIKRHKNLVRTKRGRLDTTKNYWLKEIDKFEEEKGMAKEKLKRLKK